MNSRLAGVLVAGAWLVGGSVMAAEQSYSKILRAVARDIARLRGEFPQLKEFSSTRSVDPEHLTIGYAYHTHEPRRRGGWTAQVPNPDDDGVWLYIDFHEPDSQAQIHTQPMTPDFCLAGKRVSFLILEGSKTKSLQGRIWSILKGRGVRPCEKTQGGASP
ncbi:MAG: hypothetical protein HY077_08425 [Elusimicrobia bacterium]|nr:hypothetical protein [Elusimicrobiota bacterium]